METTSREDTVQENTPLLGSTRTAEHDEGDTGGIDTRQPLQLANRKLLFIFVATSLGLAVPGIAFMIASAVLASYGYRHYRFYENWNFTSMEQTLGLASFVAIPLAITNLILLKRRGRQVPTAVNILYFGITGLFCIGSAIAFMSDRINDPPFYCRVDLDEGTYEECLHWASTHKAVTWVFLMIVGAYGVVQCGLLVLSIIGLFRNRANSVAYGRWYIPEGQLAFEVIFRWGSPREQRHNQVEPVQENQQSE